MEEFLQGDLETTSGVGRGGGNLRGLEPGDDVLTTCKAINKHASHQYLQIA